MFNPVAKKIGDAMRAPGRRNAEAAEAAKGRPIPKSTYTPMSSVGARDGYARAMNAGDHKTAARWKTQMDAEEAAARANVVPKITRVR